MSGLKQDRLVDRIPAESKSVELRHLYFGHRELAFTSSLEEKKLHGRWLPKPKRRSEALAVAPRPYVTWCSVVRALLQIRR